MEVCVAGSLRLPPTPTYFKKESLKRQSFFLECLISWQCSLAFIYRPDGVVLIVIMMMMMIAVIMMIIFVAIVIRLIMMMKVMTKVMIMMMVTKLLG